MLITWYGHSNFKIEHGGTSILVDPFFEGNPTSPVTDAECGHADLVLITHDHGDHVGQALPICARTGATLVGVFDTVNHLITQGLSGKHAVGMNIGGTVEIEGVRITMVQAVHSTRTGAATGYILTYSDGFCLYHSGDTALFASMELFSLFHDIDVALIPIGGHFTMDPPQAAHACKLLGCKRVVPMHWGTFPVLAQGTREFARELAARAPGVEMIELVPGKPREF